MLTMLCRAVLLWFKLRNYSTYANLIRESDADIARLADAHALARSTGDSAGAIRLLLQTDDARSGREALAAAYLELAGWPTNPDPDRHLHPGGIRDVAQPAVTGRPGGAPDP